MLKAEELRIGNLVLFEEDSTVFSVQMISFTGLDVENEEEAVWIELEKFAGIPLTEEWLIRFGFIYDENLFGLKMPLPDGHVRFTSPRWVTRNLVADVIETPFLRFDATHTDVYFVHSLQNLFYALTGQELTLAPPQR